MEHIQMLAGLDWLGYWKVKRVGLCFRLVRRRVLVRLGKIRARLG